MKIQSLFKSEAPLLGGNLVGNGRWDVAVTLIGADVCAHPSHNTDLVLSVNVNGVTAASFTLPRNVNPDVAEIRLSPAFTVTVPAGQVVTVSAANFGGDAGDAPAMVSVNLRGHT